MRTLKFLGMTLLMVMLTFSFTSCSSDDDDPTIDSTSLAGKWELTRESAVKADGTFEYDEAVTDHSSIIEINSNRTWKEDGLIGYWTLEGTALNVVYPTTASEPGWTDKWTVIKLTDDTLVMSIEDWDDNDDGTQYLDDTLTKTFTRVNE